MYVSNTYLNAINKFTPSILCNLHIIMKNANLSFNYNFNVYQYAHKYTQDCLLAIFKVLQKNPCEFIIYFYQLFGLSQLDNRYIYKQSKTRNSFWK